MFIIAGALFSGTVMGHAQSGVVRSGPQPSSSSVQSYWTPERMKQAKPVDVGRPAPPLASLPLPQAARKSWRSRGHAAAA